MTRITTVNTLDYKEIEIIAEQTKSHFYDLEVNNDLTFREYWKTLSGLGILDISSNQDSLATRKLAQIEGLGRSSCPGGLCYAIASQLFGMQMPIRSWLTLAQAEKLEKLKYGEHILCHALTEEHGGSDPFEMQTHCHRLPGGGWRLTGQKKFVTAAPVADFALVFAKTDQGRNPFSLSAFLVDLTQPGVSRSKPFAKTVLKEVPMGELRFDEVNLEPWQIIGEEGSGLSLLAATTTWERALLMSYALGHMQVTLNNCVRWANQRQHFGRRMSQSHQVAARISDMAMLTIRSRSLLYDAARRIDAGEPVHALNGFASATKISISEDFDLFTRHAAQLFGVRAFISDSEYCTDFAAPAAAKVYAGTNDLLRVGLAHGLGVAVEN